MAWHRLVARIALPCSLALACTRDHGGFEAGGDTTTTGTTGTTSAGSTTMGSGSGSTAGPEGSTSTASSDGSTSTADSTTGPGEPVECTERLTCSPGEICVLPCCGGPQPGCFELPREGECGEGGTPDEGGVRCCQDAPDPKACMQMQWCAPVPCTPDPPYCAAADEVMCNGNACSAESCFNGQLVGDQLQCSCK